MENRNIIVIDLETTNFIQKGGLIVEIGMASLDLETGKIKKIYSELVKEPDFGEEHRNSWIFKNSDLDFDKVMKAGKLEFNLLQSVFNGRKLIAWNCDFDFNFLLKKDFTFRGYDCPMKESAKFFKLPGNKWPKVQEAWDHLFPDEPYKEKHRGADDAVHEAKIIYELYKKGVLDL